MIRVGLIGTGRVAVQHARAVRAAGGVVAAVHDRDTERAQAFASGHGAAVATNLDDLLATELDLILVLSHTASHVEHAAAAIDAGKNVLVEKPVSWSPDEVLHLDAAARAAGVVCVPGHNSIYLPEVRRIERSLRHGDLGAPVALEISETYRMPDELAHRYNGPLEEVLIHHIYTALFLLGRPDEVLAMAASPVAELPVQPQHLAVVARWGSTGVLAQLYQSWAAVDHSSDPRSHRLHLLGTGGAAAFSRRSVVGELETGGNPTTPIYEEMFENQAEHLIVRQLGRGEPPLSSMSDAADAAAVMEAVRDALRTGCSVTPQYPPKQL